MQGVSHSLKRIPSLDHPGDLPYSPRLATAGWRESLQHPVCLSKVSPGGHPSKH